MVATRWGARSLPLKSAALLVSAACLIGVARARVASLFSLATNTTDVFALPPLAALGPASLGYRSALADLIMTHTIVDYGIHSSERRKFEFVAEYLESVIELDPHYREAYRLADTMIIYQPGREKAGAEDARRARAILERGMKELPDDSQLLTSAGQFLAFIAPQFLDTPAEKADFRLAGARAMAKAGELMGGDAAAQWHALAAVGVFTKEGERASAIGFLHKVLAMTDDDGLRESAVRKLRALEGEELAEKARRAAEKLNGLWRADLPSVSRTMYLLVGPHWDAFACAGLHPGASGSCARTWAEHPDLLPLDE